MTGHLAKQRRGCLYYGCLAGSALLMVVLVAALLGLLYFKKALNEFTDTRPAPLPPARVSPAQLDQLQRRIEAFEQTVRAHRPAAPLALSADDLNALIATDPNLEALKGKLYLTIETNQLKGQLCVPLSGAGLELFPGRYLNGSATFGLALSNGALRLNARSVRVRGKALPGLFLKRIRKQNLAQRLNADPRVANALDRLQDLQVKDGQLLFVPKPD